MTMRSVGRGLSLSLSMLLLVAAVGCGAEEPGNPSSVTSGSTTPTEAPTSSSPLAGSSQGEAPEVERPLDGSKYVADPCSSLNQAQQQEFNTSSSEEDGDQNGVSCIWKIGDGSTSATISYPKEKIGLDHVYSLKDSFYLVDGAGYFEPSDVDGYPAVYASVSDGRAEGDCILNVGVNENLYFSVFLRTRPTNDACKGAENVASAVIRTMQQGA